MFRTIQKTTFWIVLAVAFFAASALIFRSNYALDQEIKAVFAGAGENVKKPSVDTSSWPRYDNKKYGVSFRYPPALRAFQCKTRGALLCLNVGEKNEPFQDNGFAVRLYSLAGLKPSEEDKFITEEIGGILWRVNRDAIQYFRTGYPEGFELRVFANKSFGIMTAILAAFQFMQ